MHPIGIGLESPRSESGDDRWWWTREGIARDEYRLNGGRMAENGRIRKRGCWERLEGAAERTASSDRDGNSLSRPSEGVAYSALPFIG